MVYTGQTNPLVQNTLNYWTKEEIAKREAQKNFKAGQKVPVILQTKKAPAKKTVSKVPVQKTVSKKAPVLDASKSLAQIAEIAQKPNTGFLIGAGVLGVIGMFYLMGKK